MIDLGTLTKVRNVYDKRKPDGVKLSDVLAIIDKETGGAPVFRGGEPLFQMNLNMAVAWTEKHLNPDNTISKVRFASGASEKEIRAAMIIPVGALKGMYCKFRFEAAYWHQFAMPMQEHFSPAHLVLLSSSVGIGQQMLRAVVQKKPVGEMLEAAYEFMGNIEEQITWLIGNLASHADDRQLMFAKYNLGSAVKNGTVYHTYGADVLARAEKIEKWLKEQDEHGT